MNNSLSLSKQTIKTKSIITLVAIALAIALPQLFHAIAVFTGAGSSVGATFLPMHIPVLLAGLLGGPVVGLIAGILSPIVSFGISSMPTAFILPFMTIELAFYGLTTGFLAKNNLPNIAKVVLAQLVGRGARIIAILFAIYALGNQQLQLSSIASLFTTGIYGIALQIILIPTIMSCINKFRKNNE